MPKSNERQSTRILLWYYVIVIIQLSPIQGWTTWCPDVRTIKTLGGWKLT